MKTPSAPSKEGVQKWVSRNWIPLALVTAALAGYGLTRADLSTGAKVAMVTAAAVALLGYSPASRLVSWLYDPATVWLLVLRAEGGSVQLYELPPATWTEVDVIDGELHRDPENDLYIARTFNPVELTATGTWRGSLSDAELLREQEKIREIREILEQRAKEGEELRIKFSALVRSAVQSRARTILEELEQTGLPGDGSLTDTIEEELEPYDDLVEDLEQGPGDVAPSDGDGERRQSTGNGEEGVSGAESGREAAVTQRKEGTT